MFWLGRQVRVDGETQSIGSGDIVIIVPDQRYKGWQRGDGDLISLVTCIPPDSVDEIVRAE